MMNKINKIAVLGGTGFVGRRVCEKLSQLNIQVTVPTRNINPSHYLHSLQQVKLVACDVHDSMALQSALKGHDAVVNLVAVLHGNETKFEHVHVELPRNIAHACQQENINRLVHVSALGATQDAPSMYQRSKARGEAVLQSAGLDLTILRPSVIFGEEDKFLNLFARLQKIFPVMPLAGATTKFQPVWVNDVAQAVVQCLLQEPTVDNTVIEACGPDVYTLKELVQFSASAAGIAQGKGRPVWALPSLLGQLQAWTMGLMPGEPLMSLDNFNSMKVDNISQGHLPSLSSIGITPHKMSTIVTSYLGKQK
jgi:NADH dehydrogenase